GFANGMSGNLLSSFVTAVTYRLAVFGTKGCAELLTPEFDFRFSPVPGAPPTGRQAAAEPDTIQNRGSNTLLAELEAFAAAIRGGHPHKPRSVWELDIVDRADVIGAGMTRLQPILAHHLDTGRPRIARPISPAPLRHVGVVRCLAVHRPGRAVIVRRRFVTLRIDMREHDEID